MAVRDGTINLQLRSPRFSEGKTFMPYDSDRYSNIKGGSLEDLIGNYLKKENLYNNNEIIRDKKYKI